MYFNIYYIVRNKGCPSISEFTSRLNRHMSLVVDKRTSGVKEARAGGAEFPSAHRGGSVVGKEVNEVLKDIEGLGWPPRELRRHAVTVGLRSSTMSCYGEGRKEEFRRWRTATRGKNLVSPGRHPVKY